MARDDLQKHTMHLRAGDFEYIGKLYNPRGVSTANAIRKLIANYVDQFRAQETAGTALNLGELDE
jgi:hypothetical protein